MRQSNAASLGWVRRRTYHVISPDALRLLRDFGYRSWPAVVREAGVEEVASEVLRHERVEVADRLLCECAAERDALVRKKRETSWREEPKRSLAHHDPEVLARHIQPGPLRDDLQEPPDRAEHADRDLVHASLTGPRRAQLRFAEGAFEEDVADGHADGLDGGSEEREWAFSLDAREG